MQEEIESERRGWAQERLRLAAQAEEALHNLSLAEPLNSTIGNQTNPNLIPLLQAHAFHPDFLQ